MDNATLQSVIDELQLGAIEKAIFNVILSKVGGSEGSSSTGQNVSGQIMTIVPEILSISDNKNGAVNIKWKLVQKALDKDIKNQLKLEWAEDEKALDFDYTNDQIIDLNRIDLNVVHESNNVSVKNINANKFRLKWRNFSAVKTLKLESDRWDADNKGKHIQIDGNIIKHTATTAWSTAYGQVICKAPFTYHWQFKIKSFAVHMMFSVVRFDDGYKQKDTYLGNGHSPVYYHQSGNTHFYNHYRGSDVSGDYGYNRFAKNGAVLDMYLDLKDYKLTYKTGGQDIGYSFDNLPQENYRMAVSLYNKQQIELIAFDYH